MNGKKGRTLWNLVFNPAPWKVENSLLAVKLILAAVIMSGLEAAYVQVTTTNRAISAELLNDTSFLWLLSLDMMAPLTLALLSGRALMIYLVAQCFLSVILLHYHIFFYNTLTLSTIYHSLQGASSLGIDIFGFARPDIIVTFGILLILKLFLIQISMSRRLHTVRIIRFRGLISVICMTVVSLLVIFIYGKTGLSHLWVDNQGHRPAAERRLEEGARESVRSIGYVATWLGEFLSGNYKDTTLIYAESRCQDPDGGVCLEAAVKGGDKHWLGLPVPELPEKVVMIQVESLDYDVLDMKVNGLAVTPFLNSLAARALVLDVFAPHKVGSCNSDYELLNGRIADQNVVYYTYIREYPDSVIHLLTERGYAPAFFHGLPGSLFNLREAYTLQGFEEFHFKEDLLAEGYESSSLIMEHVIDEQVFDSAARHILKADGLKAAFIVTMSSHVPFMKAGPEFKSAGGSFARYLTSLNYFDRKLNEFYQQMPEGTLFIIWGDHGSDVAYPKGFGPGRRHVPFIVHLKGRHPGSSTVPAAGRLPRNFCELSGYLRCLFTAPVAGEPR